MKSTRIIAHEALFMVFGIAIIAFSGNLQAQVTGLNNWKLYIDQGHSMKENMGIHGYSEAEKVLRIGLALRQYLLEMTDIQAVYVARETDFDNVSLGGRTDQANTLAVDFYYSIHSDAGPPEANRTLMLYGGWRNNGVIVEKTPNGGAAFGTILNVDLPGAMRIPTSGNFADRVFYDPTPNHHTNQFPWLWVNRQTNMASLLSEGGFHTNPTQNQRNMNAEWKKLEALAAFWSILQHRQVQKPAIGVALGFITDVETNKPLNGITVQINGQTYITDTFESLFSNYTNDPNLLGNGFYFFENLTPLQTYEVTFTSPNHQSLQSSLTIASNVTGPITQNLSFLDVALTSIVPPVVEQVQTSGNLTDFVPGTDVNIRFSRKMDRPTVEAAISIQPSAQLSYSWTNDFNLVINTNQLQYLTNYILSIDGGVAKGLITGQFLDGDANGTEGGNYTISIATSAEDTAPPVLLSHFPAQNQPANILRPIIRLLYDERIVGSSITQNSVVLTPVGTNNIVPGVVQHTYLGKNTLIHFFPTQDLNPSLSYTVSIAGGLTDIFNNQTVPFAFNFSISAQVVTNLTVIDNFNGGIVNWWAPQQAGQTLGIVTGNTGRFHDSSIVNHTTGSTGSMRLDYEWQEGFAGTPYIRQHLPPGASQNTIRFNRTDVLQFFLFGDGTGNEVRLMIRDGSNHLEANAWIPVAWKGWKLISWDLTNDPIFGWVNGNGVLEGSNFFIDGFHLRKTATSQLKGSLYFDDLRFVRQTPVSTQDFRIARLNVYPNPTSTRINIASDETILLVQVFSIDGKLITQTEPLKELAAIDVSDLQRGTYIVRVMSSSGQIKSFLQVLN